MFTREELAEKLKTGVYNVKFTKVDGTERVMPCTLVESYLPPAKAEDPMSLKKVREISPEVMSAWCTDANGWRSFRVANVLSIEPLDS